jgi:large subunit ribosomal protein L3
MAGLLGKKIGMTQVFSDDAMRVSVTAIEAGPCAVLALKDKKIQLGFDVVDEKRLKRPQALYYKKLNIPARRLMREVANDFEAQYKVGDEVKVDVLKPGDHVDVTGVSIGKGFQGGMKRWNWKGASMTHGQTSHRRVGSMGSTTTPGRVWKGHHLPGHMGARRVTIMNLRVVKVDVEQNLLLVEGAVPGFKNGYVVIRTTKKKKKIAVVSPQAQAKKSAKAAAKGKK